MGGEPAKYMMGKLPNCLRNNERGIRVKTREDVQPLFLRSDETVPEPRLVGMGALYGIAMDRHCGAQPCLHGLLSRPANLIGRLAGVAARHKEYRFLWFHGIYELRMTGGLRGVG